LASGTGGAATASEDRSYDRQSALVSFEAVELLHSDCHTGLSAAESSIEFSCPER
jgi:hypothetical protein